MINQDIIKNIFREDVGPSDIVSQILGNSCVITDVEKGSGYVFVSSSKLWSQVSAPEVMANIPQILLKVTVECKEYFEKQGKCDYDDELTYINQFLPKCLSFKYIRNVFELLKPKLYISKFTEKLNVTHPYLLPIKNGHIIDLRNGKIIPRTHTDYFTFECNVSFGNISDKMQKFIDQIMPDKNDQKYLQMISGLFLTGESPKNIFLMYGGNGKLVWLNMMRKILSNYHTLVNRAIFVKKNSAGDKKYKVHAHHLLSLKNARFGTHYKRNVKNGFNEGKLELVSNKNITTEIEDKYIDFKNQCKIALIVDTKEAFYITNKTVINRIVNVKFSEKNISEDELSEDDINDFFTWCVVGSMMYYEMNI
jgi:hypothetical protein